MSTTWFALTVLAVFTAVSLMLVTWLLASCKGLRCANAGLSARNRELEHGTVAKSRFVANMSHELRTPLNAVIGFAELMSDERAGKAPLSETQREHLGIIRYSADHIVTLINEVLDMARIEAGHMRLVTEVVQPASVAAQCLISLQPIADEKQIRMELRADALDELVLDPARLRQVMLNFLSNAIRFTAAGGSVTLTLACDGERLRVEVTDSGPGISPADQPRVFEEFVQLERGIRGGTGLGLAITKQIVEAQGGEVGLRSRLGSGSTFYAALPWVAVAPASEDPAQQDPAQQDPAQRSGSQRAPGVCDRWSDPVGRPGARSGLGAPVGAAGH